MNTNTAYFHNYNTEEKEADNQVTLYLLKAREILTSLCRACSEWLQKLRLAIAGILIRHPKLTLYSVVMLCVLTVCSIFFLHTNMVNAQSDHINEKYFTVIEVKSGDTLWEIAQEYRTSEYTSLQEYIREVREINHITGDEITSGCYLTIPYYAEEPFSME